MGVPGPTRVNEALSSGVTVWGRFYEELRGLNPI